MGGFLVCPSSERLDCVRTGPAYNTGSEPSAPVPVGARREIHGKEAALNALRRSVKHITSDRVRNISTRMVPGDPAQALLDAADSDRQSLIVVGTAD
jgi:hypothetical protein